MGAAGGLVVPVTIPQASHLKDTEMREKYSEAYCYGF